MFVELLNAARILAQHSVHDAVEDAAHTLAEDLARLDAGEFLHLTDPGHRHQPHRNKQRRTQEHRQHARAEPSRIREIRAVQDQKERVARLLRLCGAAAIEAGCDGERIEAEQRGEQIGFLGAR
jgi:hypothetical protein